ncbi:MAG: hypothetical protein U5N86_00875 [Planctomycetota bacterium]|nr:hypothetical protein [Planctomycetota bacterium]
MDKDKEITVEPRPATYFSDTDYENTFFGFKANEFSDSLRLRTYILNRFNGVYLAEVTPGGQFAMNIIPAGSVIIKVGETFTPDLPSLKGAISEYEQVGKSFKMLVCKPDGYNMPVYCTVKVVGE